MWVSSKIIRTALAVLSLGVATTSAQAAMVNFTVTGTVLVGEESGSGNDYLLSAGDTITAYGTFDDSALVGGTGSVLFGLGSGNSLTISAGTATLLASMDQNYDVDIGFGYFPQLVFDAGLLVDFDTLMVYGQNGAPADFDSYFLGFSDFGSMYGEWNPNVQITAVPVPAAIWLLGSGLLGLAGVARRRK
ncbi:MAG: VPLPA-CTERM sorting domain-containing protein [Gammaproteobacteria bacterium]|nr:VPLPA-CTERM sorting domain-containing protein [Gammaproteobacteria bacterium]